MQEVFLERRKGHLDENLNALFLASVITVQSALFVKLHFVLIVAIATVLLIIGRSALLVHWTVELLLHILQMPKNILTFKFGKCRI